MGDFNAEPTENAMAKFMKLYNLINLVKRSTCHKNRSNPSCIDLILTNRKKSFQSLHTFETGLSDFHKMGVTVMPFMSKPLKKEIMKRSRLKNKFLKDQNHENKLVYNKQRKRKTKRSYFDNIDTKNVTDNIKFWKTIKPVF